VPPMPVLVVPPEALPVPPIGVAVPGVLPAPPLPAGVVFPPEPPWGVPVTAPPCPGVVPPCAKDPPLPVDGAPPWDVPVAPPFPELGSRSRGLVSGWALHARQRTSRGRTMPPETVQLLLMATASKREIATTRSVGSGARSRRALDSTAKTRAGGDGGPPSSRESKPLLLTSNGRLSYGHEKGAPRRRSPPPSQAPKQVSFLALPPRIPFPCGARGSVVRPSQRALSMTLQILYFAKIRD